MTQPSLVGTPVKLAVAQQSGTTPRTVSVTVPSYSGTGILCVFTTNVFTPTSVSAASWNGNALTHLASSRNDNANSEGTGEAVDFWYLTNPTPATANLSITFGNNNYGGCFAFVLQDCNATTPFPNSPAVPFSTTGTTSPLTTSSVTSTSNDLVISIAAVLDQLNSLANSGGTIISSRDYEAAGTAVSFVAQYNTSTSPSPAWTWTAFNAATGCYSALNILVAGSTSGYNLTAAQGSYSLTGQTANLLFSHTLTADQGSYSLTGQTATLIYSSARVLVAAQGSYALTGSDALIDTSMNADSGSYTLTGFAANLVYTPLNAYILVADQGSYALNGQTVNLNAGHVLTAVKGQYNLSGQFNTLIYSNAPIVVSRGQGLNISRLRIGL